MILGSADKIRFTFILQNQRSVSLSTTTKVLFLQTKWYKLQNGTWKWIQVQKNLSRVNSIYLFSCSNVIFSFCYIIHIRNSSSYNSWKSCHIKSVVNGNWITFYLDTGVLFAMANYLLHSNHSTSCVAFFAFTTAWNTLLVSGTW